MRSDGPEDPAMPDVEKAPTPPFRTGGPRTCLGKSRTRGNARSHGIFSSELTFSASEQREFNKLEVRLRNDLNPHTPLREVLFDSVVAAAWRMKLAVRVEQAVANKMLSELQTISEQHVEADTPMHFPYVWSAYEIRRRLKLLERLKGDIEQRGRIAEGWEKPITEAFGSDLWKNLGEWAPVNTVAVKMFNAMIEKAETFKMKIPGTPPTAEESQGYAAAQIFARQQMVFKIIDLQAQHLRAALWGVEYVQREEATQRTTRLDLILRYKTAATRDFYRALAEYRQSGNSLLTEPPPS